MKSNTQSPTAQRVTIFESFRQLPEPNAPVNQPAAGAHGAEEGLYIISVAARILHMHPQTLRKYERFGLVRPSRTIGMLRLYSERDITKLRMIKHLVDEMRLNLAGVEMALSVFDRLTKAMEFPQRESRRQPAILEQAMGEIMDLFLGHTRTQITSENH